MGSYNIFRRCVYHIRQMLNWMWGPIRRWRKDWWDHAIMYDPEYDMWFENHPLHPNYKENKNA